MPMPHRRERLVQLHDMTLLETFHKYGYGLGVPCLISWARSVPWVAGSYVFEHRNWQCGAKADEVSAPGDIARAVLDARPFLAGFTLVAWSERVFLEAIRLVKERDPGILVAVGGPLATGHGAALLADVPQIDYLVSGYGEIGFVALLRSLLHAAEPTDAPGLHYRRGGEIRSVPHGADDVLPPHAIPSPYRNGLLDLTGRSMMHVEWSRGCRFACAYCSWSNALRSVKPASRERIIDDIDVARDHSIREIQLLNSAINFDTRQMADMCDAIAEGSRSLDAEFTAFLRHDLVDEEQLRILRTVPFRSLIIGIQTDDPQGLKTIGRPPLDMERIEWVVRRIGSFARAGVEIISGLPGDSPDGFHRRLDRLLGWDCDISVFHLQVTPGSQLWRHRVRLGLVPDPAHHYYAFETPQMTARQCHRSLWQASLELSKPMKGGRRRYSHNVPVGRAFWEGIVERRREGRPLVQLHHANVVGAGGCFGLGVPFLISHCRSDRALASRWEFEQVAWKVSGAGRFEQTAGDMLRTILEDPPAVAGFSLQPWSRARMLEVIREVKALRPDTIVVVGGPIATVEQAGLIEDVPQIDYLVTGEGEAALAGLLKEIARRDGPPDPARVQAIGGILGRCDGAVFPAIDPAGRRRNRALDTCGRPFHDGLVNLTARSGDPCVEWTRGSQRFSAKHIAADVEWIVEHGFEKVLICDSAINRSLPALRDLCALLHEVDTAGMLAWSAYVDWTRLTPAHVGVMSTLRWDRLLIGLQRDDPEGIVALGRDPQSRGRFEAAVHRLAGIVPPCLEYVTGIPGDSAEVIRKRVGYALSLGCRVSMLPLFAVKGTAVHRRCMEIGATLDEDHGWAVRDLPTMSRAQYLEVLSWARGPQIPAGVLETSGYDFLDIG